MTRGIANDGPSHGTKYRYQLGCREECCRRAQMRALKAWRMGMTGTLVDATGTKRRIQALLALGWTLREIGEESGGYTKNWAHLILKQDIVVSTTAAKIDGAFERLCMTVPIGPYRVRTRNRARHNGWLPPLVWNDIDDPDEQPTAGRDHSHYLSAELVSEWDHLRRSGESIEQAARQLGVSVGAIEKAIERVGKDVA